jgi:hypothetical protein
VLLVLPFHHVWFDHPNNTLVHPKVSGLATWIENCKWYSSLPVGAVVLLFVSQSCEFCRHNHLCRFSTSVY